MWPLYRVTQRQKKLLLVPSYLVPGCAVPSHNCLIYSYSTSQYIALAPFFKNEKTEAQNCKVSKIPLMREITLLQ